VLVERSRVRSPPWPPPFWSIIPFCHPQGAFEPFTILRGLTTMSSCSAEILTNISLCSQTQQRSTWCKRRKRRAGYEEPTRTALPRSSTITSHMNEQATGRAYSLKKAATAMVYARHLLVACMTPCYQTRLVLSAFPLRIFSLDAYGSAFSFIPRSLC